MVQAAMWGSLLVLGAVLWHDREITTGVTIARDLLVGSAFAVMLYAVRCALAPSSDGDMTRQTTAFSVPVVRFAAFSYTLYLVHEPPLAFVHSLIGNHDHAYWRPSAAHVALYCVMVIALVAYARGITALTEDRTGAFRAWMRRTMTTRATTPAGARLVAPTSTRATYPS
ncbi:MAG TPA: hypothetical protein VGT98_17080 [Candidatus Elarobacter sp.]|nr:hypothetical protein [Candidatus Elarobacter sp.]